MKKMLLLLVVVGLVLAAAAYWISRPGAGGAEGYTLAPVEWGDLSETAGATGVLEPEEVVVVGSPLSGEVVEVYPTAAVNRVVREGEALLKLDDRLARQKLAQAEAAVRAAAADVGKAEALREAAGVALALESELRDKQLISAFAVDKARADVRAAGAIVEAARAKLAEAQAARSQAQIGLDRTVVRVPGPSGEASGSASPRGSYVVIERKVERGQLVAPPISAQLFVLAADLGRMRVHVQVSEDDVGRVRPGLAATFNVYAYPGEDAKFRAEVGEIRPVPTRLQGLVFYDALLAVTNQRDSASQEWKLRPGMTASVNITLRTHAAVWKVPDQALDYQPEDRLLSEAARVRLARWQEQRDREDWRAVWVLDEERKPWPALARTGGKDPSGEPGIADGRFTEVLEWDPELTLRPEPGKPATYPRLIVGGPPGRESGASEGPRIKLF